MLTMNATILLGVINEEARPEVYGEGESLAGMGI